jgi:hypothetical protein
MVSIPATATGNPSVVEAEIDAVTWSQGIAALEALASTLSAGTSGLPPDTIVKIEDLAAQIDPKLIPLLGAIRLILPKISGALDMLAPATGSPWSGDPRLP